MDAPHVHSPHFEQCDWCEATIYLVGPDPALHVCTAPVGHAPARKERPMTRPLTTNETWAPPRRSVGAPRALSPAEAELEALWWRSAMALNRFWEAWRAQPPPPGRPRPHEFDDVEAAVDSVAEALDALYATEED